ncbi:MAG: DUF1587 domain-containing protein, partial [Pirellulaceae bacterium]|nr:DUF1587 domain-containing protein [Pirellulaceae bacterium]
MKTLKIAIQLVFISVATLLTADDPEIPITMDAARDLGREKSRFLSTNEALTKNKDVVPKANVAHFRKSVRPLLTKNCLACHGPNRSEGRLRVDQLNPNLLSGSDIGQWREVYNALSNSEMPPDDEPDYTLSNAERGNIVDWLSGELNKASLIRRNNKDHSSFRRLTKYEYNYALQDLLGLPYDLANKLPPEAATEDGFKNSSELLQMSAMQFETYREIGLKALKRATVTGERPEAVTYIISMQQEMHKATGGKDDKTFDKDDANYGKNRTRQHLFNQETGKGIHFSNGKTTPAPEAVAGQTPAASPVMLVLPRSNELKMDLGRFLPDEGIMRVRIRARRSTMAADEYAALRLIFSAHTSNNANFSQIISQRDLPVTAATDNPEFIHFDIPLG